MNYGFHNPKRFAIVLSPFVLFVEDDIFAGQLESSWQKVILVRLLLVVLLVKSTFIFFQIFVKHIFAA
jgi:hypothetical protein